MSDGKWAWSGRRVSERKVAAPYASQGTHRYSRYRADMTAATAKAEALCPDGKLPPLVKLTPYLNQVSLRLPCGGIWLGMDRPKACFIAKLTIWVSASASAASRPVLRECALCFAKPVTKSAAGASVMANVEFRPRNGPVLYALNPGRS